MNINTKVLINSLGLVSIILIIWSVFLMNDNKKLRAEHEDLVIKFEALDGFLRLVQLELDVSRDSVRLLEQRMDRITEDTLQN